MMVIPLVGIILAACAAPSAPATGQKTPGAPVVTPAAVVGWEAKWNAILAEGKKEGKVAVYTHWIPKTKSMLAEAFKEKYGIDLEYSTFVSGSDLLARVKAEKGAGIYAADLFGMGVSPILNNMKPEGLLGPIKPMLILPDVLDPKTWFGGAVPFPDKDGLALAMIGMAMHMVVYNTSVVKDGEITTYKDLLKPQYKGKITMHDPSYAGSGNAAVTNIGHYLWGEQQTTDFLRRLVKEQEIVFQRDYRLHMESIARGKYGIGIAPSSDIMVEFFNLGAPVKMANVEEDTIYTSSAGAFGVPTKFAHPNATIIFINWLLTKEGQTILSKSFGNPSRRLDVSTEGIDPLLLRMPGKKYYDGDTEESLEAKKKWAMLSKKVMDEAMK